MLTPQQELAYQRELNIREAQESFWMFCCLLAPEFYKGDRWHLKLICETLQALYERRLTGKYFRNLCDTIAPVWYIATIDWIRLEDDKIYTKVMQNIPPRTGKSRTLILFCEWIFGKSIKNRVITCSYNDDLAGDFSKYTRDGIQQEKNLPTEIVYSDIFPNSRIQRGSAGFMQWALVGTFFSYKGAGIQGSITGKGGNCFPAGTKIITSKGLVCIDEIWIRDGQTKYEVLSYNHDTYEFEYKPVLNSKQTYTNKLITIKTAWGGRFSCTPNHLLYNGEEYVKAQSLKVGNYLMRQHGMTTVIHIEEIILKKEIPVYDIQVADNKNFLIGVNGMSGILVHNCTIVDDPIKSAEEAFNELGLAKQWQWYTGTFLSRLEDEGEGGIEIVNMTRWSKNDICGRILSGPEAHEWIILSMDACSVDGQMLCPSILSEKKYKSLKLNMDENIFMANYHQQPVDAEGRLYKNLKTYDQLPVDENGNLVTERIVARIDTADEGSDYLCNIVFHEYQGEGYIVDVYYTKDGMEITELETARILVENRVNYALIESNNGGKGFSRNVEKNMWDIYRTKHTVVEWFHQSQNKIARILSNATFVMNHIYFPVGWNNRWPDFYRDVIGFQREGKNKNDDAPDCLTGIAEMLGSTTYQVPIVSPVVLSGNSYWTGGEDIDNG